MPKLILIQPTHYASDELVKQKKIFIPSLTLPHLASLVPKQWDVKILLEVIEDIDYDEDVDLVGIGSMGQSLFRGLEIAKEFKKRGKIVFFGGYMASMIPNEVLKNGGDSVVVGDSEIAFPKLLKDYQKKGKINKIYHNPITSLDNLPLPRYDLLIEKKIGNMLPVQAGRGCPNECDFCSIAALYNGKYIQRPIDEVMRDIKRIKELGFNNFFLIDDNIVSSPKYLMELARRITPLKMSWASQCSLDLAKHPKLLKAVAKSGCKILSFGLESITQEGLDKLNKEWVKVDNHEVLLKRINDAGIMISSEMIIGTDSDTEESIRETYKFIDRLKIQAPRFWILAPIPGTTMYKNYKKQNRLLSEDFKIYGQTCVYNPEKISAETVDRMYWWLYKKVFSIPCIIRRVLLRREFVKNPIIYLSLFIANLHYRGYVLREIPPVVF